MTHDILQSAYEIRRAMGSELLNYLKRHDPARYERVRTKALKKRVLELFGPTCLICGRREPEVEVQAAHVQPVEEGGESSLSNLVPLCFQSGEPYGCHQLYDRGFLARSQLRSLLSENKRAPELRETIVRAYYDRQSVPQIARPLPANVVVPNIGHAAYLKDRTRGIRALKSAAKACKEPESEFFIRLRLADLLRRGRSTQAPRDAWKEITRCQKLLKHIPLPHYSRFYYEYGYILHLLGDFEKATDAYERSAKIAYETGDDWSRVEEIIAIAQGAVVKMLSVPSRGSKARGVLQPIEQQLVDAEKKARDLQNAVGNRWAKNCLIHRSRLHIKIRNVRGARALFSEAVQFRDSLDAFTGWTATTYNLLLTNLLIATLEGNYSPNLLLGMCSRAIRDMLFSSARRPEGIRDALIAFGHLLESKQLGEHALAEKVKSVANRTRDPLSGLL